MKIPCAAAALALAAGAAFATPAALEFKGLRIGMSEADFKKANPKARCDFSERDPVWDNTLSRVRACRVDGYALDTKEAVISMFRFYEGQLGGWSASFYGFHERDLKAALTEKFGVPAQDPTLPGVAWTSGSTRMKLMLTEGTAIVFMQSGIEDAWQLKRRELERRKGKIEQ